MTKRQAKFECCWETLIREFLCCDFESAFKKAAAQAKSEHMVILEIKVKEENTYGTVTYWPKNYPYGWPVTLHRNDDDNIVLCNNK